MKYLLKGKEIFTPDKIVKNSNVLIVDDLIQDLSINNDKNYKVLDVGEYRVLPGLIDMHIHGANGYDTMDANYEALNEISKYLAQNGVTAFLPTTVTARWDKILAAVKNVDSAVRNGVDGAAVLGAYVEGPFITAEHKGSHPEAFIRELDIKEIKELLAASNSIRVVTIAPEKKEAPEIIKYLKAQGILVSLGHTNATFQETIAGINSGASLAVHIFNGMRGLHHREPGVVGAVLFRDDIYTELLADMIHVHPAVIEIVIKCKGKDKICLMTDCIRAGGLTDGEYVFGEQTVVVTGSVVRVKSGSLAGSTLKLINAIRNVIDKAGVNELDAVNMASLVPARILKLEDSRGSIETGKKANFTVVDDEWRVIMTIVNGKVVYKSDEGR